MKKTVGLVSTGIMALVLAAGTGCGDNSKGKDSYKRIVDEHAAIFLPMDEDGYLYEQAVGHIGDFISGTADHAETLEAVQSALEDFYERQSQVEEYRVDRELGEIMMDWDILPEEFESFGNSRANQIQNYIIDLEGIAVHLLYAPEDEFEFETVEFWHELYQKEHESMQGYYYYGCVNYWFAPWEEKQTAYVQEKVINNMQSYLPDSPVWEKDRDTAEQKVMAYLDLLEECSQQAAEYIGKAQEH